MLPLIGQDNTLVDDYVVFKYTIEPTGATMIKIGELMTDLPPNLWTRGKGYNFNLGRSTTCQNQ